MIGFLFAILEVRGQHNSTVGWEFDLKVINPGSILVISYGPLSLWELSLTTAGYGPKPRKQTLYFILIVGFGENGEEKFKGSITSSTWVIPLRFNWVGLGIEAGGTISMKNWRNEGKDENNYKEIWRDSKVLILHTINLDSILGTPMVPKICQV